eukprot:8318211-Pyramimonas_sp.AAC.1
MVLSWPAVSAPPASGAAQQLGSRQPSSRHRRRGIRLPHGQRGRCGWVQLSAIHSVTPGVWLRHVSGPALSGSAFCSSWSLSSEQPRLPAL